jgi:hypothetical protein
MQQQLQGKVSVVLGESRLSGKLLAIEGAPNPFGEATNFLANRNIFNNSPATIKGDDGKVGTIPVFFMTSAVAGLSQPLAFNLTKATAKPARKAGAKKPAKKPAKKSGKKSDKKAGAKKGAKKAGAKKGAVKKAAKKTSRKGARK